MVGIIITVVINCIFGIVVACIFSHLNAREVCMVTQRKLTDDVHYKYKEDKEYLNLVNQYKLLLDKRIRARGVTEAIVILIVVTLFFFFSITRKFCQGFHIMVLLPTMILPSALALFIVYLINKWSINYIRSLAGERCQVSSKLPSSIMEVIEKHSYIENIEDVSRTVTSIEWLKSLYKCRIAEVERLQHLEYERTVGLLMFSATLATFCFIFETGVL